MKKVLYISDVNANETIFHSQVIPHFKELKLYYDLKLLCLSRGEFFNYDFAYRSIPGDYVIELSYINFILNKSNLFKFLNSNDFSVIYARGFRGGLLGCFIKYFFYKNNINLITDVRGDVLDEYLVKDSSVKSYFYKKTIKKSLYESNNVFFVSSYLREKYVKLFDIEVNTAVYPTFVPDLKFNFISKIREDYRKKLGYNNEDVVLLYSGNLAKWQNVEFIISTFENVIHPHVKLLILTKDRSIFDLVKNNSMRDNIQIHSSDYSEIQNFYFASDYGLLIRDQNETNRCSSPTKFSEYINSGLKLISKEIQADFIDVFNKHNLKGFLYKHDSELLEFLNSEKVFNKDRNSLKFNLLSEIVDSQKSFI
tara:strand:- start:10790 stop:11890 length:1101 start_codon:yes stop_codon:yes gene_type:complete